MRTLAAALSHQMSLHKPASRQLRAAGIVLLASAAIHLTVLLVFGGQWAGPVSLRKPITFGLSTGLLIWTLGWIMDRLPSRPRLEKVLGSTLVGSSLLEVGLITVQAWRGVPSHFNIGTPLDSAIFSAMGITVVVMSVALLGTTVWVFAQPPTDPAVRLAARAGLVLIIAGLGVGGWMISLGTAYVESTGHVPDRVQSGAEGVPSFPHAVGFHGIQVFLVVAVVAGVVGLTARTAQRVLRFVIAGYAVLWLWSIAQAALGRAPFDLQGPQMTLAALAACLLIAAVILFFRGVRAARSSATEMLVRESALPSRL